MNKFAKGAIATGVGVILLVGGGGTLATWNQTNTASMGSVVAGNLNLSSAAGVWTNAAGTVVNVASYKVVPGDVLTYKQTLTVTLTGDLMTAKLSVDGATAANGFDTNATVATTFATPDKPGTPVVPGTAVTTDTVLLPTTTPQVINATTTFTFKKSTTAQVATNASVNLNAIGYRLDQQAPVNSNNL